jgi:hypothetical protein
LPDAASSAPWCATAAPMTEAIKTTQEAAAKNRLLTSQTPLY